MNEKTTGKSTYPINASSKKSDSKVTRYEARRIVEETILEDYLKMLKGAKLHD